MTEPDIETSQLIRQRIRAARELRGVKQAELAKLLEAEGLNKQDAGRIERGQLHLNPVRRRALALVLQVPERWFTDVDLDLDARSDPERLDAILARLDAIEAGQQELLSYRREAEEVGRDPEEAFDRMRLLMRMAEEVLARTGRDVNRRERDRLAFRSELATDHPAPVRSDALVDM